MDLKNKDINLFRKSPKRRRVSVYLNETCRSRERRNTKQNDISLNEEDLINFQRLNAKYPLKEQLPQHQQTHQLYQPSYPQAESTRLFPRTDNYNNNDLSYYFNQDEDTQSVPNEKFESESSLYNNNPYEYMRHQTQKTDDEILASKLPVAFDTSLNKSHPQRVYVGEENQLTKAVEKQLAELRQIRDDLNTLSIRSKTGMNSLINNGSTPQFGPYDHVEVSRYRHSDEVILLPEVVSMDAFLNEKNMQKMGAQLVSNTLNLMPSFKKSKTPVTSNSSVGPSKYYRTPNTDFDNKWFTAQSTPLPNQFLTTKFSDRENEMMNQFDSYHTEPIQGNYDNNDRYKYFENKYYGNDNTIHSESFDEVELPQRSQLSILTRFVHLITFNSIIIQFMKIVLMLIAVWMLIAYGVVLGGLYCRGNYYVCEDTWFFKLLGFSRNKSAKLQHFY